MIVPLIALASVQPALPDAERRLTEIAELIDGRGTYDQIFSPRFRADVPRERFDAIAAQLRARMGRPTGVGRIARHNALEADASLLFERGRARVRLTLMPGGMRQVAGFAIIGTAPLNDDFGTIAAEAAALPGITGFGVYALEDPGPRAVVEQRGAVAAPIGSGFKLWVLAELAAQVNAGRLTWDRVVPLGPPSLASGMTQDWPAGTPMTVQSLATLMIAISDNTATDTLIALLGREAVDARALALGADPAGLPVLTTAEAFRLKHPAAAPLSADWAALGMAARHARLADSALARVPLDPALFGSVPVRPDIEWFASPRAMARTLDWLSRRGGATVHAILATARQDGHALAYTGSKGGSEPGILSLNHLARDRAGRWFAVVASQQIADGPVDPAALENLVARALDLLGAAR